MIASTTPRTANADEALFLAPETHQRAAGGQGGLFDSDSGAVIPAGLTLLPEFVTLAQATWLLEWVDSRPWLGDLRRRVQHYGWRYDYRERRVSAESFLGDIPPWAKTLGSRWVDLGLIPSLPDQVIVNEYVGAQGIAAHVDSLSSFRGPVVTVSLCEPWQMIFRGPRGQVYAPVLPDRSAVILAGESRESWSHEIPRRTHEAFGRRGRRVSLTFRTVAR